MKVELTFTAPDEAPTVDVLEKEGGAEFVESVQKHVRTFRAPCLALADTPAALTIEFVFKPDARRAFWTEPVDSRAGKREAMLKCISHESKDKRPDYPISLADDGIQGSVLAQMRFVAPDSPPEVRVYSRPSARRLKNHVESWARGYRMPCHEGAPVETTWTFRFRFEGDHQGFKPLTLRQLLGNVPGIGKQRLFFDFNTMACPFDVRLRYWQSQLPNLVAEMGDRQPSRRPFLNWLSGIELDLPSAALDAVFGDDVTITIPCTKIDLNPKE